jgi:hypothetical protein
VEVLTDREGKQANTIAKKEEMFRGESFRLNEGDQYNELPPAGHAHKCITEQSVERGLFSQSDKNALGLVLATVPDRHFGFGSGSKPNRCRIGGTGRQ